LGTLTELPLELRVVWNQLSCECRGRGGAADCCLGPNAHIPVTGVGVSKQDPAILLEEQQFLRQACLRTDQAIITFCRPPPIPIIPGPPPAFPVRSAGTTGLTKAEKSGIIIAAIIAFLICCCPWRRRWIFCAGGKPDDSSDESSSESEDDSEDGGGMRHVVTKEGGGDLDEEPSVAGAPDIEEGAAAEPDDDAMQLRAVGEEEDGDFGGAGYGRTVEMPEYEEEGEPRPTVYEQNALNSEPEIPIVLLPIPGKSTEEEDEPYDLEYVRDEGIVECEREGEWAYDADGGWTPEERAEKDPLEWDKNKYDRDVAEAPEPVDARRERALQAYDGGEVFDQLEQEFTESHTSQPDDLFDWVIQSTLNTLDQKADNLVGSIPSGSSTTGRNREEQDEP
jgi:hypothetical protein